MKMPREKHIIKQVKASYSAIASEFNQTRQRPWKEFDEFLKYVKTGAKVLDLACGNGRLYASLKEKDVQYLGLDHNPELLEAAKKNHPEAKFELADMSDLKLPSNHFDSIFCIAAFHHLPNKKMRKELVKTLHQSLKKEGVLIITVWNLFQPKYLPLIFKGILRSIFSLGHKGQWNDTWVKWGNYPLKRYYHAFLPRELKSFFKKDQWKIEAFYFTKKGKQVSFFRSFNINIILKKRGA